MGFYGLLALMIFASGLPKTTRNVAGTLLVLLAVAACGRGERRVEPPREIAQIAPMRSDANTKVTPPVAPTVVVEAPVKPPVQTPASPSSYEDTLARGRSLARRFHHVRHETNLGHKPPTSFMPASPPIKKQFRAVTV